MHAARTMTVEEASAVPASVQREFTQNRRKLSATGIPRPSNAEKFRAW
jgi:hypothetical protein